MCFSTHWKVLLALASSAHMNVGEWNGISVVAEDAIMERSWLLGDWC